MLAKFIFSFRVLTWKDLECSHMTSIPIFLELQLKTLILINKSMNKEWNASICMLLGLALLLIQLYNIIYTTIQGNKKFQSLRVSIQASKEDLAQYSVIQFLLQMLGECRWWCTWIIIFFNSLLRRDVVEDALKALVKAFTDLVKYSRRILFYFDPLKQ